MKCTKKFFTCLTIVMALVSMTTVTAFAGGHHGSTRTKSVSYSVCSTQSCTLTGLHKHNGTTYSAHYYGDGHTYHGYCNLLDCDISGYHVHDGAYAFGHTINDGHDYHDYCGVANCTISGYHGHDGEYHFGHTSNDGHSYHNTGGHH